MGKEELEGPGSLLSAVLTIALVGMVFSMIWEGVNALLESMIEKHERLNSSRFQTITPIIRNILMIALTIMSLMVILSELGINIMPLLAGAGVLGIAIGFGAQTLVKDFLTGLTVVFEDLLQIGDVVKIGDKFGLVEKITLRKVQLRDLDGTVHTVPFGDVTIVSNLTKEFSYYIFEVGVAYRENVDEVISVLKELDEVFREDEAYASRVLAPLEVLGLDRFDDSAVVIKARYKTQSHERWNVGREFNRRIKAAFDERNIEIPFPHQTIYFGEDKQGSAPNANVRLMREQATDDQAS
jgi:small conductance mechanosensitive channel